MFSSYEATLILDRASHVTPTIDDEDNDDHQHSTVRTDRLYQIIQTVSMRNVIPSSCRLLKSFISALCAFPRNRNMPKETRISKS
jgi:hypothetical protein